MPILLEGSTSLNLDAIVHSYANANKAGTALLPFLFERLSMKVLRDLMRSHSSYMTCQGHIGDSIIKVLRDDYAILLNYYKRVF